MDQPYDSVLVVSFGGPEAMSEVMPFLENVLRGKNVPPERMREVARHYEKFDGVSPINEQNRRLVSALRSELETNGPQLPVYWGNRNWHPLLVDTLRQMKDDGRRRAIAFFTSAYSSYSGCRQYLENLEVARSTIGADAPAVEKLRGYYNHPGFVKANIEHLSSALRILPISRQHKASIAFAAHSIPLAMASTCDYEAQLLETSKLVADGVGTDRWRLVFQSRSGPPNQPWLEPDICDYLSELREQGADDVIIAPIGFVSDHMEIIYDLDTMAMQHANNIGLNVVRAATVGTHPAFIRMIRELILERIDSTIEPRALGVMGPRHDVCLPDCCSYKARSTQQ